LIHQWIDSLICTSNCFFLIQALKTLLESSDEKVKKEAEGALWILEEKNEPHREAETKGG